MLGEHADARAHHPVADRDPVDPVADGQHLAAAFDAGHERRLGPHLVLAAAQQHVGEVEGDGRRADEDLARTGFGNGPLDELEHLRRFAVRGRLPCPRCHVWMPFRKRSVICSATCVFDSLPETEYQLER